MWQSKRIVSSFNIYILFVTRVNEWLSRRTFNWSMENSWSWPPVGTRRMLEVPADPVPKTIKMCSVSY